MSDRRQPGRIRAQAPKRALGPVGGAASQGVVHGLALLLQGGALALLLPHLGPTRAATYVVVISVVGLIWALLDGAVGPNVLREITAAPRPGFLRSAVTIRAGVGVAAGMLAGAALAASGAGGPIAFGALLAGGGAGLHASASTLALVALREQRWVAAALPEMARGLGALLASAAVVATGGGVVSALTVLPAAAAAALAGAWFVAGRPVPSGVRPTRDAVRILRTGSVVLGVATACATSQVRVAVLVCSAVAGPATTGDVALVARVAEPALAIVGLLAVTAMPALANAATTPQLVRRLLKQALPVGVAAGVLLAIAAPVVVDVVGGGRFPGAATPLRVLAAVVALATLTAPAWAALLSARRDRAMLTAGAAGLLVTGVAVAALTPGLGATGTVAGIAAGQAVLCCLAVGTALRSRGA